MGTELIPFSQIQAMAKTVTSSGLFGLKNDSQVATLMLLAQSENIHPMTALQQYHIVNGRPVLKSTEILSRFQRAGGKIKYIVSNETECAIEFSHESAGSITIKWDIDKAKRIGLYNSNPVWQKYPENMLRSRCISDGVKAIYPSCLGGFMSESDAQDIPIVVEAQEVPVVDTVGDLVQSEDPNKQYKEEIATKLRKYGFTTAMIKEFANTYKIANNEALLYELANNDKKLLECINKFEGRQDDNQ